MIEKLVKFDEIKTFQNLPIFFEIAIVYSIGKVHKYNGPLWKATEICFSRRTKFIKICEKITEI